MNLAITPPISESDFLQMQAARYNISNPEGMEGRGGGPYI